MYMCVYMYIYVHIQICIYMRVFVPLGWPKSDCLKCTSFTIPAPLSRGDDEFSTCREKSRTCIVHSLYTCDEVGRIVAATVARENGPKSWQGWDRGRALHVQGEEPHLHCQGRESLLDL